MPRETKSHKKTVHAPFHENGDCMLAADHLCIKTLTTTKP